jgi:hypothetical protein
MKLTTDNLMIAPARSGGVIINFESIDMKYQSELLHKYEGKKLTVDIKIKREGRSLDANAYCWVLCGKIAETKGLLAKKTEIYKQAVRDYGVTQVMPVKDELAGDICRWHDSGGLGNDHDVIGPSKYKGYTNVMFYYGSSGYNTKQMSVLLDGLVADAQELGIQTETPEEIAKMKAMWGE